MTTSANIIEDSVSEYLAKNPDYQVPEESQHPVALALSVEMTVFISDKLGGIDKYWATLFQAVQEWFNSDDESFEYRFFRSCLFCACGMAAGTQHEESINSTYEELVAWENTTLSRGRALTVYAKAMNNLDLGTLGDILSEDFKFESQMVVKPIESKVEFLKYIHAKLETIRNSDSPVFAEMGRIKAYGEEQPCVILAQGDRESLVGVVLAKIKNNQLSRIDLCVVPSPEEAVRSSFYP